MPYVKLVNNHPTLHKLETIFRLMEDLKITIDVDRQGGLCVSDKEHDVKHFELVDMEDSTCVPSIPPTFEYKLSKYKALRKQY